MMIVFPCKILVRNVERILYKCMNFQSPKVSRNIFSLNINTNKSKDKLVEIVRLPSPILTRLPKKVLEKSKFFKKEKRKKLAVTVKPIIKQSYAQATNPKVTNILKLKKNYLNLPAKKNRKHLQNHQ